MSDKYAKWRRHLDRCEASGMSMSAYCKRNGISSGSLSYYRRKFLAQDQRDFIPAQVDSETRSSAGSRLRLLIGAEIGLEFDDGIDPSRLAAIVDQLKRSA